MIGGASGTGLGTGKIKTCLSCWIRFCLVLTGAGGGDEEGVLDAGGGKDEGDAGGGGEDGR